MEPLQKWNYIMATGMMRWARVVFNLVLYLRLKCENKDGSHNITITLQNHDWWFEICTNFKNTVWMYTRIIYISYLFIHFGKEEIILCLIWHKSLHRIIFQFSSIFFLSSKIPSNPDIIPGLYSAPCCYTRVSVPPTPTSNVYIKSYFYYQRLN